MALPPNFIGSMTLKALLEDPNLKNPPTIPKQSSDAKIKKEGTKDTPQINYGSAFLGPNLWDKTYDNFDFNLEYMDLDEFLSENEIPAATEPSLSDIALRNQLETQHVNVAPAALASPRQYLRTPPIGPEHFLSAPPSVPQISVPPTVALSPALALSPAPALSPTTTVYPQAFPQPLEQSGTKSPSPPASPVHVDFQVSDQDLALTCAPGNEFDPRKRNFTDEELKPQPIIKKSKKVFVPDGQKDDRYWARREKNNFAAKRSRDARRVKENQIALRAAFLEKENKCLRDEMTKLKKENSRLKGRLSNYEPTEENST